MLTTEEFRAWCQRFHLSGDTAEMLSAIRAASPVRKVRGRASNVAGRYPSPKMQRSIQFESQHVELWAVYAMERDETVLEYYDQPLRLPLRYRARSGRYTTQWHTPDFFVLRTTGGSFEEWKPGHALEALAVSMPNRYQRAGDGTWHCPPGDAWAQPLGLGYQLRSSAEYHPLYMQNLKFLQDFWAHPAPIDPEQERLLLALVDTHPGLRLAEATEAYPTLSVDVVWALLATGRLFTDLAATSLMRHDHVALFRSEAAWVQASRTAARVDEARVAPLLLLWDHRLWQADVHGESVTLRPEVGEALQLSGAQVQELMERGACSPAPLRPLLP